VRLNESDTDWLDGILYSFRLLQPATSAEPEKFLSGSAYELSVKTVQETPSISRPRESRAVCDFGVDTLIAHSWERPAEYVHDTQQVAEANALGHGTLPTCEC
jgi:hypothetical protein